MGADKITIRIENHNGLRGRAWDAIYPTYEQAADAIRAEYGWTSVHIGEPVDRVRACYDGEEAEETEGDSRWAAAPKVIVTVEHVA